MTIRVSYVLIIALIMYGLGVWSAFHIQSTTEALETFRVYVVKKVTGQSDCPKDYTCMKSTPTP